MINKQYTADRNETAGSPNSKIPAVMANYWISAINSLISDLQPVKDAGGALIPIDFNIFAPGVDQVLSSFPMTVNVVKKKGNLAIASSLITLPKGFVYKISLGLEVYNGIGNHIFDLQNASNVSVLDTLASTAGGSYDGVSPLGYGLLDLTASGVDVVVKIRCTGGTITTAKTGTKGGLLIDQYKKIPFTATS